MMNKLNVNKENKGSDKAKNMSSAVAAVAVAVLLAIAPLASVIGIAHAVPNTKESVLATQQVASQSVESVQSVSNTVQSRWSEVGVVEADGGLAVLMADCLPGEIPTMPQFQLAENVGINMQMVVGVDNFLSTLFLIQNYGDERQHVSAGVLCMDTDGNPNNNNNNRGSNNVDINIQQSIRLQIISIVTSIVNNYNINQSVTIISNSTTNTGGGSVVVPPATNGTTTTVPPVIPGTGPAPVTNTTAPVDVVEGGEEGTAPIANTTAPATIVEEEEAAAAAPVTEEEEAEVVEEETPTEEETAEEEEPVAEETTEEEIVEEAVSGEDPEPEEETPEVEETTTEEEETPEGEENTGSGSSEVGL